MIYDAIEQGLQAGVNKFLLFGLPTKKDEVGCEAYNDDGIIQQGLRSIKERYHDEVYLVTDICMCEYTSHGHCGILDGHYVNNDKTLKYLAKIAVSHAKAGADMVAPSDMMDGRVAAIRNGLDENGFINTPIMSYAVKYASSFYGPFRDAAGSAPSFGDRKTYQMDYHNVKEAIKEALADEQEGADMLMVKPALSYLDVIKAVASHTNLPLATYSVSGEYAMIKAAAKMGLIDEYGVMCESAISMYRAGADILITYYAKELAQAIKKGDIG
jgi:porphobilinogen synthase